MNPRIALPLLFALFFTALTTSNAAVTYWSVEKGTDYLQTADNTQPAVATNWYAASFVRTDQIGDAISVVMEGGNIVGSIAFTQEDTEWELWVDYASQAELDAVFPAGPGYSIILSYGGGSVTQQFSIAADAYPPAPFLSGADYSTFQAVEVLEPFEVSWDLPFSSLNSVGFELFEGSLSEDGDTVFDFFSYGPATNTFLPRDLFVTSSNYNGEIGFVNSTNSSGLGGFGIDGQLSFNAATLFPISTVNTAAGYDDFNDNSIDLAKWDTSLSTEAGKNFSETNQWLEFTSDSSSDGDSVAWAWDSSSLNYTQDWSVAMDVANLIDPASLTSQQWGYLGLIIFNDGFNHTFGMELYLDEFSREIFNDASINDIEVLNATASLSTNQASLKISFDADTKMLYSAYSTGGDYIVLTNYSVASWGMTDSSVFDTALFSGSNLLPISAGQVYADNFRIYGESPISNNVSLIELDYLRDYDFPDSDPNDRENRYSICTETSHRVNSISVLTAAGDQVVVTNNNNRAKESRPQLKTYFETAEPISTPWDPANDGDWTITVGYNNGTFQSTIVPFTKEDGTTPIPVINKQPLFSMPITLGSFTTNTATLFFEWNSADANANILSIDDNDSDETAPEIRFYAENFTDDLGVVPTIDGTLTNLSATLTLHPGTNSITLNHAWARTAYNDDGVGYIVVKGSESDYLFIIVSTDDLDGDGMPDYWETDFFGSTNAVNGGPLENWDRDALNNLEEYIAGGNPTNSDSVFGIEQAEPIPSGFIVSWTSVDGRKYGIKWADSLTNTFQSLATDLPYPQNSYTDTTHTAENDGFYSINVQLQD